MLLRLTVICPYLSPILVALHKAENSLLLENISSLNVHGIAFLLFLSCTLSTYSKIPLLVPYDLHGIGNSKCPRTQALAFVIALSELILFMMSTSLMALSSFRYTHEHIKEAPKFISTAWTSLLIISLSDGLSTWMTNTYLKHNRPRLNFILFYYRTFTVLPISEYGNSLLPANWAKILAIILNTILSYCTSELSANLID